MEQEDNKTKPKTSIKNWLALAAGIVFISYIVISWLVGVFGSRGDSSSCRETKITKEIQIKDKNGKVIGTKQETFPGVDCGDGMLYPPWEER